MGMRDAGGLLKRRGLLVRVACEPGIATSVAADVQSQVVPAAEITPRVALVPPGAFSDAVQNDTFRRFVDEREQR